MSMLLKIANAKKLVADAARLNSDYHNLAFRTLGAPAQYVIDKMPDGAVEGAAGGAIVGAIGGMASQRANKVKLSKKDLARGAAAGAVGGALIGAVGGYGRALMSAHKNDKKSKR